MTQVFQILCALVSSDDSKQQWLQSAGIVSLLRRLTLDAHIDIKARSCSASWLLSACLR